MKMSDRHLCVCRRRDLEALRGHRDGCSDESWASVLRDGCAERGEGALLSGSLQTNLSLASS